MYFSFTLVTNKLKLRRKNVQRELTILVANRFFPRHKLPIKNNFPLVKVSCRSVTLKNFSKSIVVVECYLQNVSHVVIQRYKGQLNM